MIDTLERKSTQMSPVSSGVAKQTPLKADSIFLSTLPWTWFPKENNCDAGIHYDVEVLEPGTPKGVVFSVCIKESAKPKYDGSCLCVPFESKKLTYIYDQIKKPVFIILVDTKKQSAFWLFAQEYVAQLLEETTPDWRQQDTITLRIPATNNLSVTIADFRNTIYNGLEFVYLQHFHSFFRKFESRIISFMNSPEELEQALRVESTRPYGKINKINTASCSCSHASQNSCGSCQQPDEVNDLTSQSDNKIQTSLEQAQSLKVLDPKENRIAYYTIYEALNLVGERASVGVRYTAMGEMAFYDYLLHFLKAFDAMGTKAIVHLTQVQEHQRYFKAVDELIDIISSSLDKGELIVASMLTIRLADTLLFASPYIITTFGQEKGSPLMEYAQSLLVLAHDMASIVESPGYVIQ